MSTDNGRGSAVTRVRVSQWEDLMRKIFETHKEECKAVSVDIPRVQRSAKQFPTGSQYEGTWDVLGMSGYGVYTFPNEVIYEGEFEDGMFHGRGELRYPNGATLRGVWSRGELGEKTLAFADNLEYDVKDWPYCVMPDRRFTIEHDTDLRPAGESYLTAEQPTREIPIGFYDTGDGFFDRDTKVVYKADDLAAIVRYPAEREQEWIIANCRTNPDLPLGPRQELYEEWSLPKTRVIREPSSVSLLHVSFSHQFNSEHRNEREFMTVNKLEDGDKPVTSHINEHQVA